MAKRHKPDPEPEKKPEKETVSPSRSFEHLTMEWMIPEDKVNRVRDAFDRLDEEQKRWASVTRSTLLTPKKTADETVSLQYVGMDLVRAEMRLHYEMVQFGIQAAREEMNHKLDAILRRLGQQ